MSRSNQSLGHELVQVPDRLIIKGPLTLEQVGRLLGVSRERVRQIESKAMRKLLDGLRSIGVDAPESILEVHTDKLSEIGPKKFERLPLHKTKPGGATAAARRALVVAGIGEPLQKTQPRNKGPRLRKHPNGQWYVPKRINGRRCSFYFGQDRDVAEQRMLAELLGLITAEQNAVAAETQLPLFEQCCDRSQIEVNPNLP